MGKMNSAIYVQTFKRSSSVLCCRYNYLPKIKKKKKKNNKTTTTFTTTSIIITTITTFTNY